MVYEGYKVVNIYLCKDGRLRTYLHNGFDYKVISYSKYLMENYLDRYLEKHEIVHHKDENPLNNEINNLQILTRYEHGKLHHKKNSEIFICPMCRNEFTLVGSKFSNYKRNKQRTEKYAGPFCSRSCAGKWSTF